MYLSQLDVIGFKSFAQKTKFKFNQGISAVVGPNGCGKTNVVDAIRWVLGEQKSAVLRSEVMDNVIFNGTKSRKPLSMAEVSLQVINNKGVLPSEYHDILITRRLYRDGESEYLINNTKCRLRDITDLFMDTGLGSDSYSVIELKMVEAILSGRPEERRHLLEEAAGVNKYKQRRREATRKLQNIRLDLDRIKDLVVEIEKNVNTFSRQAAKTKRYNKLMEEYKELEIALIISDYKVLNTQKVDFTSSLNEEYLKKENQTQDLSEVEADAANLQNDINQLNIELNKIKDKEISLNSDISSLKQELAVSKEKMSSFIFNQSRIEDDKIEQNEKLIKTQNRNTELKENIESSTKEYESNIVSLKDLNDKKTEKQQIVREIRENIQSSNANITELKNNINNFKNNIFKNNSRKDNLEELINKVNSDIEISNAEIDKLTASGSENQIFIDEQNTLLKKVQKELSEAQERKTKLKTEIDELQVHINENQNNLSSKNASLNYLKSLSDKDANANYLSEDKNWNPGYDKNLLIESVSTDEKYRIAIESLIGQLKNAFIINNLDDAREAVENLRSSKKGKSNFVINNFSKSKTDYLKKDLKTDDKIYGYAINLIRFDESLHPFLSNLLQDTVIVEDLEVAKNVIASKTAISAVTLTGEILNNYGYLKAGGVLNNEGQIVGKNERIKLLKKEIEALSAQLSEQKEKLSLLNKDFAEININALNDKIKSIEKGINEKVNLTNQLNSKIAAIKQNIDAYEKNNIRYLEEIAAINKDIEEINANLKVAEKNLNSAQEEIKVISAELESEEKIMKAAESEYYQAEMNKIKLEAKINAFKNEIERNLSEIQNINNKLNSFENEKNELIDNTEKIKLVISEIEDKISVVQKEFEDQKIVFEDTNRKKINLDEQEKILHSEINIKRKNLEKISENIHQTELKLNEITTNIKNLNDKAFEILEIAIDDFTGDVIEIQSIQEAKEQLNDLKTKLAQLGNVNFLALEQFEKESERFNFYNQQLQDLNESEKTLQATIDEINNTAEKRFRETFDLVNNNFQMLFKKLFNDEAESDLKLMGDSILDCDIEIMAKPPGKKPHSIEMLSQGEKTLTAIALLFGIYLVKPSPFCILDEVDAPLDDMNIDRFLNMIKQFSKNTQFLIVTHNKRTMTAADTLYGITMQEEGVSKVVSVKFNQDEEIKAE